MRGVAEMAAACGMLVVGCGSPLPASPDAAAPPGEAGMPEARMPEAGLPDASVVDAAVVPDAAPDAAVDACVCPPPSPCHVLEEGASCEGGDFCGEVPAADGTACDAVPGMELGDGLCVLGVCTMAGCGNGYREADELCDDGNLVDGDACSSMCLPETLAVVATPDEVALQPSQGGGVVGEDGLGRLLFVWTERPFSGRSVVRAQRADRGGVLVGMPMDVATDLAVDPHPQVVGLATTPSGMGGGFVVAWEATRAGAPTVRHRHVAADGTLGAVQTSPDAVPTATGYRRPAVARLSDGYVIGWTVVTAPTGANDLRAQRFGPSGARRGPAFSLPARAEGQVGSLRLASEGDGFIAVWGERRFVLGASERLYARRFSLGTPQDGRDLLVAEGGSDPAVARIHDGYAVAFLMAGQAVAHRIDDAAALRWSSMGTLDPELVASTMVGDPAKVGLSVAGLGGDAFLVGWSAALGQARPGSGLVPSMPTMLPMHYDGLAATLAGSDGSVALSPVTGGAWLTWSAAPGGPTATLHALFLPHLSPALPGAR